MARKTFSPEIRNVAGDEQDQDEKPEKSKKQIMLERANPKYEAFFKRYGKMIEGYIGTSRIPIKMEEPGWFISLDPKNIFINADPSFFLEKGYTESEAIFASFHECEHFLDMIESPDTYEQNFDRIKTKTDIHPAYPKALSRLYNCIDDVVVNRRVMRRWKSGVKAKDELYPKLFPSNDFHGQPKHRQFMYAILRGVMMPGETPGIDPEVQAVLDELGKRQIIERVTQVDITGKAVKVDGKYHRFDVIRTFIEKEFEKLYKDDLENWKPPEDQDDEGGESGEPGGNDDPFGEDPNKDAIPDPIDMDDAIDQINKAINEKNKQAEDEFKKVMGVEKKDFERYQKDYAAVEPYINDLADVFEEVIQRRITYRHVFRKPAKEGPILSPARLATGMAEIKAGQTEPEIFLERVKKEVIREQPSRLEFTLVCDGSGSMESGMKKKMQRQLAVLVTEAFAKFRERIEKERRKGGKVKLSIMSEVRLFSDDDQVLKPLSESLTHVERVEMHKKLIRIPGGGNNEPKTFQKIDKEQFDTERISALHKGDLKKIIVFLTDGETNKAAIQKGMGNLLEKSLNPKTEQQNLIIAGVGFAEGKSAKDTYAPNGFYENDYEKVPDIFKQIISGILDDF